MATIGIIGLGRMGKNIALRLLENKHGVVAYNRTYSKVDEVVQHGAVGAKSIEELCSKLKAPRIIWIMLPEGPVTDENINELLPHINAGDIVIDGGNANYNDSLRRAKMLAQKNIQFLDVGTSGGIWGLKNGFCLMIGGDKNAYQKAEPIFKSLAPENGYAYIGASGSGHFVKMVHNSIEYALMESYSEGFELLEKSGYELDLKKIAGVWNHGSVVRSWLLELCENSFAKDPHLKTIKGYVDDSGEGRWSIEEAIKREVPYSMTALALFARFRSRQDDSFAAKLNAAMRNEFGGHEIKKTD